MREGLQAALDAVNAEGGAGGTRLATVVLDSRAAAGPSVSGMRQLTSSDDAVAVVTAFTVPPLAQLPLAERGKVPLLNGGGNDPALAGHDWLFNDVLSVAQEERAVLDWVKQSRGVRRLGLIATTAYTEDGRKTLADVAEETLGTAPTVVTMDETATDATSVIEKLLAEKPDAIFVSVSGTAADLVFKQLAQRGVDIPILTGSQIFAGSPALRGLLAAQFVAARQEYKPSAAFIRAMGASASRPPSLYAGTYYTLGLMLAAAVESLNRAGKAIDGENVQAALNDLGEIEGCCGPAGFNADHASTSSAEVVTFSADGEPTVVETVPAGGD